ncbi:MAG: hypothetical protein KA978_16720, partial [Deltaproteobacteria bacterium]|nr:hypothetical protein [Deltaproteobacteria bacterium]
MPIPLVASGDVLAGRLASSRGVSWRTRRTTRAVCTSTDSAGVRCSSSATPVHTVTLAVITSTAIADIARSDLVARRASSRHASTLAAATPPTTNGTQKLP